MWKPLIPLPGCALNNCKRPNAKDDPPWLKQRGYPHFDRVQSKARLSRIIKDADAVASRSFYPFLAFDINQKRYKRNTAGTRKISIKKRPVAFASHVDAAIFAYYNHILTKPYEKELSARGLSHNVLAYRKFYPVGKSNIDFAFEAFSEIERQKNCVSMALDIESFFDTIPHQQLKKIWCMILGTPKLPDDHYAVFKAITRWSKVNLDDVYCALHVGRRRRENWDSKTPLCTPDFFRRKIRGLGLVHPGYTVTTNGTAGIPQGSPISALLSNLVMLNADTRISRLSNELGVYYRRYSDDVLLIGKSKCVSAVEGLFKREMQLLGLSVHDEKTKISRFRVDKTGDISCSSPFQYLGFTFDGRRVQIRPQSIAKFIQRRKRTVQRARRAAIAAEKHNGIRKLYRRSLYAKYSHLGPDAAMMRKGPSEQ